MRIGAYQFAVTGDIQHNFQIIKEGVRQAVERSVRLLVFPECALTGYPPRDIDTSADVDFAQVRACCDALAQLAKQHDMYIIAGTIARDEDRYHNRAIAFMPDGGQAIYDKRGLWGRDRDNFCPGQHSGILTIDGVKIGLRICYEVRFPEYFRELYRAGTELDVVLFYDVSDIDDVQRYELIRSHIRTRAMENVTHTLAVNTVGVYQTAPTGLYDRTGGILGELARDREQMMVYDFRPTEMDFGERGRKEISDHLIREDGMLPEGGSIRT